MMPADQNPNGTMEAILSRLGPIEVGPLPASGSAFVQPQSLTYHLDGVLDTVAVKENDSHQLPNPLRSQAAADMVKSHPSVGILMYHKDTDSLLTVRQAEGRSEPPPLDAAFTYELCAGLIDKAKSLEEIAAEEIEEECGFRVEPARLQRIASYNSSVGISGAVHHMFFCEVTESDRISAGGGLADSGEAIEVLGLPLKHALGFAQDDGMCKSAAVLFGIMWLLARYPR